MNKKILFIILGIVALTFIVIILVIQQLIEKPLLEEPINEKPVVKEYSFNLTTTKLATILEGYEKIQNITFTPDGRKVAYVAGRNLVINNSVVKSYDFIGSPIIFSPDGEEMAYKACDTAVAWICFMVRNDEEIRHYEDVFFPVFSSDSQFAFFAQRGDKIFPVINGEEGESYDWEWQHFRFYFYDIPFISPSIAFSPDSQKIAYGIIEMTREERTSPPKGFIVLDGVKEEKTYEIVLFPTYSPDSQKIAYVAMKNLRFGHRSGLAGGDWFVVVNGKEGKIYDWWEGISSPVFSPDSQKIAYVAKKDGKLFIVVNDKEEGEIYDSVHSPVFSPDSQKIAYVANRDNKEFVIIDGKEGKDYDKIYGEPQFSPNGQYIAYGAQIGNELWWIVEEIESFGAKD